MHLGHPVHSRIPDTVLVSIIVPTLASADRSEQLYRAIFSVQAASHKKAKVIVCVNGNKWDANCVSSLKCMFGVEVHELPEPSLPKAIAYGRSMVNSQFFGFLDDDDELLPGAIDSRLSVLLSRPDCDLVATNGLRRTAMGDEHMLSQLDSVPIDPLRKLFEENWLPSCGALFRTATVGQDYFNNYHEYAEWTWLAYRLSIDRKKVAVVNSPTFVVNDTPGSLSKSVAYRNAYAALYLRMLECKPPTPVRRIIRARLANTLHDQSTDSLQRGDVIDAARLHLQSMVLPGGLRFSSYSRHILKSALIAIFRRRN